MKRTVSFLCAFFIFLTSVTAVFARELPQPLTDDADVLTGGQYESLTRDLEALRQTYQLDVSVVLDTSLYRETVEESADAWYDRYDHGYGLGRDGILFYISVADREYYLVSNGYGETAFTKGGINYLKREIEPHLKNGNYYQAIKTYITLSDELISMAKDGNPYTETDWSAIAVAVGVCLAVSFLGAFIMMKIQLAKMNTAVANDYASNYEVPGSYHLDMSRDIFLYSRVTKIKKANTNAGSSSGGSRSGGGGRF